MFRPWHHSKQRASTSSRTPHSEDAQPNECVDKRQRNPPAVNTVTAQQPPWRARQRIRWERQFVFWGPSGSMRPTSGNLTPTLANASQPAGKHNWTSGNFTSTPSVPPLDAPPPKRRKLGGTPSAKMIHGPPSEKAFTPTVTPVSSETFADEHKVKRERSVSPDLPAEPRVITAGSKRYAPLPPECKKSKPNHKAARSAWAKKEGEVLRRLGLKVVRTFVREDGMVIDWEATNSEPAKTAAVMERALHAGILKPSVQSTKPTTPSLAHRSQDSNGPRVEKEKSAGPSVIEIAPEAFLGDRGGCESVEDSGPSAKVGPMNNSSSDPYQEAGNLQGHAVHTRAECQTTANVPAPIACLSPGEFPHDAPSDHSLHHQISSDIPSHATPPSGRAWTEPSRPQQRTISPQVPQGSSSPSPRAIHTLQHILHLKRQVDRESSDSPKPPIASPSLLPTRKLYPVLKRPQSGSPSRRSPGSSADAVAAAINKGTQFDRLGPSTTAPPGTPLRVYKKRPSSSATTVRASAAPQEHQARCSQSSGRYSTPPIAVLRPTSSPLSRRASSSSACGDEYDELELSYPSPPAPPPGALSDSRPPVIVLSESPPPVERVEEATLQPSLLDLKPSSPDENDVMRSSALHYLERYCQTFDTDRRALAGAYAHDAFFSCSSRSLRTQGRDNILDALQVLGPGVLCSGNSVEYDVTYLGPSIGVLLVVLGVMGGTGASDGEVRYAMSFVLRPGREDQERLAGELRPLVAAVHQMVLRDDRPRVSSALMPSAARDG